MTTQENEANEDFRPRVRPIEMFPAEVEGQTVVCVRDTMQLVEEVLTMTPLAGLIVALFDGSKTLPEIAEVVRQELGQEVAVEEIGRLAEGLDERFLLVSDKFAGYYEKLVAEFAARERRPAFLADKSYPADPGQLRELLESFFTTDGGPGLPTGPGDGPPLRGLVAPHIDLVNGGACFAHAYHALASAEPADVFVVLGTGHSGARGLFVATDKAFETPLGNVETDQDFVGRLQANFGDDLLQDEILHRTEHVIEFQALFLQLLFGDRRPFKIVPLLCSYVPEMTQPEATPEHMARIEAFGKALRSTIRETAGKVCVIASVDLAHMGPRYGDQEPLTPDGLRQLNEDDGRTLALLAAGDREAFNEDMLGHCATRRICGYPCLDTMLACGDFADGKLLIYDQAQVDDAGSVVSFAGMAFAGKAAASGESR
ncbi:AmmeMemoRadiSam system protein B [Candidatus Sumerlaeota bacterium]